VATFDATAMAIFAFVTTGGAIGEPTTDVVLWGSAAAAGVAAMVIAIGGPPEIGWAAIGYILFASLLVLAGPQLIVLSLAIALMPVMQRPRASLGFGVGIAAVTALALRLALSLLA
jgi:hypothetical protein